MKLGKKSLKYQYKSTAKYYYLIIYDFRKTSNFVEIKSFFFLVMTYIFNNQIRLIIHRISYYKNIFSPHLSNLQNDFILFLVSCSNDNLLQLMWIECGFVLIYCKGINCSTEIRFTSMYWCEIVLWIFSHNIRVFEHDAYYESTYLYEIIFFAF